MRIWKCAYPEYLNVVWRSLLSWHTRWSNCYGWMFRGSRWRYRRRPRYYWLRVKPFKEGYKRSLFLIFKSNLKSNLIEKRTWIVRYWPYLLLDVLTDGREADGGRSVAGRATFSRNFCALAPRDGAVWEDWGDFGKGLFLIVVNFLFVITRLSPRIVPEIKLGKGW